MRILAIVLAVSIPAVAGCGKREDPAGVVPAPSIAAERFDFRGIQLGVLRSEFKSFSKPPIAANPDVKNGKVIATCHGDPSSRKQEFDDQERYKIESDCWWEYDTGAKKGKKSWERYQRAAVLVGDDEDKNYRFEFAAMPGDEEPRLHRITVYFPSKSWSDVVSALSQKFGSGTPGRSASTLDSGEEIYGDMYTWRRADSSVQAIKSVGLHNIGYVSYSLTKYSQYVYDQQHKNDVPAKDKM